MGRILDLFVNKYNYTDFHELNLDWMISDLRTLAETLENFVSLNTIKYADPIQWNISTQYGTNTIVMDPNTGTAYLSVQPVPVGVSLSNTDYWTKVFDLSQIITAINQNLTINNAGMSPTATFNSNEGDWILWNDNLYVALTNINAGDAYTIGSNIDTKSVEMLVKDYVAAIYTYIGLLSNLTTTDKSSIVNAINELVSGLNAILLIIGDLNNLTTTDKSSVVNAINELVSGLNTIILIIGDLNNLSTTDKSSVVNAINELVSKMGNLSSLSTMDKSSLVNAINETYAIAQGKTAYRYFEEWGAKGDGVTDDTTAFNAALASGATAFKLLAGHTYIVSDDIYIRYSHTHITAEENATVKCADNSYVNMSSLFTIPSSYDLDDIEMDNFTIDGNCENNIDYGDPDAAGNLPKHYAGRVLALIQFTTVSNVNIHNMTIKNAWNAGMWLNDCPYAKVHDNIFDHCRAHSIAIRNNTSYQVKSPSNIGVYNNVISHSVVGIEIIFGAFNVITNDNIITNCKDSEKFPSYAFDGTYPNVYPKDPRFNTPSDPGYITPAQQGDGAGIESTGAYTDPSAPTDNSLVYSGNTVYKCMVGLRVEELTNDCTIIGNNARDCDANGIFVFSARKVTITGNIVNYNPTGISIDTYNDMPCNINITSNQINSNTVRGIDVNGYGINIVGNQFDSNPVGIVSSTSVHMITICANTFYDYYGLGGTGIDLTNFNADRLYLAENVFDTQQTVINAPSLRNAITTNDSALTVDSNYSWYVIRNGVLYFQVRVSSSDTNQHYLDAMLPSAMGDYIYLYETQQGVNATCRIDSNGVIRVQIYTANTNIVFNGSYPLTLNY